MRDKISKKNKKDGIYFIGNNAQNVTGSCIYIRYNGKQILLEYGMVQSNNPLKSYRANSQKRSFKANEIDYLFLLHSHIDHSGLIPMLIKNGFKGKIITTRKTAAITKTLLLNSVFIIKNDAKMLSKRFKRNYQPLYNENNIEEMFKHVYEYDDYNRIYKLDDTVSFQFFENSHCVGASQMQLILKSKNKQKKIFYSSDLGGIHSKNSYVDKLKIVSEFSDVSIMESTYGEKIKQKKINRNKDNEKLRTAINTTFERGGKVIMPCFSFAKSQEILTNLYELYHNDENFNYDIIVDSKLTCEICKLYGKILSGDYLDKWKKVYNWSHIKYIVEKDDSRIMVKDNKSKLIISSAGFCNAGRILCYLEECLKSSKNMIIFSGYTGNDSSYLSYKIKNFKKYKTLKINRKSIANRADCICLNSYSSHASRKDLIKIGGNLNTEKLILVHGSENAKLELAEDLKEEISKNDKCYKVLCSTKDMVIHL